MSLSTSGRTWEDASSPVAVHVARRFETAWRRSKGRRPEPDDFLPPNGLDRPGARLALLRADIALRWEAGEKVMVEWYRDRYPDLGDETLVALIYEEFCLREENQDTPDPAEYRARFPEVASRLRRVFDIHGLVGSGQTTTTHAHSVPEIPYPEAGQTIAGFHLVEELGRGAFARVFLAEERQLADRPVALKVARSGSREPQTLARLQHTHIVPVHSTRTDPATGLHLLCMPYFGRVTLATLLADPEVKSARTGAVLVEALDRLGTEKAPSGRSNGRIALARRSYALAIAWWGGRMAEALEHAHERGVLHRDVKPSNVLVTGDGMPMLLDFNLAREAVTDDPDSAASTLGGTLDYMAPEHLEALADGMGRHVDARSDIYGLGVLLYESLMGERPFLTPKGARSAAELLLLAAEERRAGTPSLRSTHPEVPAALEAVVRRCLAPEPKDRYATAGELAADLQAVADDRPLKHAREPLPSRALRWTRRNRRALAMAAPLLVVVAVLVTILFKVQLDREHRVSEVENLMQGGTTSAKNEDFRTAVMQFDTASRLSQGRPHLESLYKKARERARLYERTGVIRANADTLFRDAEPLRFRLTLFLGDLEVASQRLQETLKPFYVLNNPDFTTLPDLEMLDDRRRNRLHNEVNELLFLWVAAVARDPADQPDRLRDATKLCERVLGFASPKDPWPKGPWKALRGILAERLGEPAIIKDRDNAPSTEDSPLTCFQWGYIREIEGKRSQALDWFRRAAWNEEKNYWYHYYLAYLAGLSGFSEEALRNYGSAVSLAEDSPWARLGRGQLLRERGALAMAWTDLKTAETLFEALQDKRKERDEGIELRLTRLALGFVRQRQGDPIGARAEYDRLIAANPDDNPGRAARLNRATLDAAAGAIEQARDSYDSLVASDPDDLSARQGRALLALQAGEARSAEADFSELVRMTQGRNDQYLANRAMARLLLGRVEEAEADAKEAARLKPSPGHTRLWTRILLALGRVNELPIDRPDELARLPLGGLALMADLRKGADRLEPIAVGNGTAALRASLTRALLLAAVRDPAAERVANQAVALAPLSPQVYLVRGRVYRWLGAARRAESDADRGLELDQDDVRLLELRGRVRIESGKPRAGLADIDRAIQLGAGASLRGARGEALLALEDTQGALREWTEALRDDPEDPGAYLGRARAYLRRGESDLAMTELEQASAWAGDQPGLNLTLVLVSARCLPGRPDQIPRAIALARRAWGSRRAIWPLFSEL
ncbi:serine/threonine-protein kinase [Singulisphaera acidiphila]|uniref:Serine/threonine protein kinase n=1 Tax=Singulisphaera acidiphila (strain ATCC BAA-1392 / DSM 18658 / VKM B-2454 / MOB10) TaxID=886293 RepID=L0D7A0_SINAD|nr:serine/threonine-protein kinase [Singulisphaera acidiphila]AGA25279.1 serine/threonine protein kinase [Singulisphaera acidiphila DSM 18658]